MQNDECRKRGTMSDERKAFSFSAYRSAFPVGCVRDAPTKRKMVRRGRTLHRPSLALRASVFIRLALSTPRSAIHQLIILHSSLPPSAC